MSNAQNEKLGLELEALLVAKNDLANNMAVVKALTAAVIETHKNSGIKPLKGDEPDKAEEGEEKRARSRSRTRSRERSRTVSPNRGPREPLPDIVAPVIATTEEPRPVVPKMIKAPADKHDDEPGDEPADEAAGGKAIVVSEWICTCCNCKIPKNAPRCHLCNADFRAMWFCGICNGPVPGDIDECMLCGGTPPIGRIAHSAKLVKMGTDGVMELTSEGYAAARQGEEEGQLDSMVQGRKAKGKANAALATKVQSITMKKDILILKICTF
jgi:hypothetical protein